VAIEQATPAAGDKDVAARLAGVSSDDDEVSARPES
jgi:hypothetical protein